MAFSYRCTVALLVLLAFSPFKRAPISITAADDSLLSVFEKWISDNGRVYGSTTEKLRRFQVFKDNYLIIQSIKNQPGLTYTVDLNAFADLTNEEFLQRYATHRTYSSSETSTDFKYGSVTSIPSSIDWRTLGAVTPIKDQGSCGSCWAFSAVATIEGINQIRTGHLISLSEQELVDCVWLCKDVSCLVFTFHMHQFYLLCLHVLSDEMELQNNPKDSVPRIYRKILFTAFKMRVDRLLHESTYNTNAIRNVRPCAFYSPTCVTTNFGCNGGWPDRSFKWVVQNGGITTEDDYPYISGTTNTSGTCASKTKNHAASITGYEHVPANSESALAKVTAYQPVSILINANSSAFMFYSGGIFTGPCGTILNHAVAVVGYSNSDGNNYWIVKNSWGTSWGESGYIRMQKDIADPRGLCGLAMYNFYPKI
ncbi:senescence-specific cysteine protease SAG39-like [Carex rostrata]